MPFNSVATDGGAGGVTNNAMRYRIEKSGHSSDNAMRKDDDLKPRVSLEKPGITGNNAMRNSYAMRKTVNCLQCNKPFERRTTWQKYCCGLCKVKAYEVRTGKNWKNKKGLLG